MSSSVFYKFKSSKEPQRITFDGTGISVFELKRDIIQAIGLGDGTDADLSIYADDTNEEYDDDTTIIPRSTTVLVRRTPAARPGHGRAARYLTGKAPVNAKNSYRTEAASKPAVQAAPAINGAAAMAGALSEEDRIAAMFAAGGDQWEQQKQKMADAKPVFRPGFVKGKPHNVPEGTPPDTYICHRCHVKGHWIQACPTNDDPNFENKPRIKRTTGIPRSMLQIVEKPVAFTNDGLTDESRQPSGVMVNAAGDYVIAKPDEASWKQFQEKAQASAAQQEAATAGSKELRERGLECAIDKRMFVEPMKTPCCGNTFCNDCIENALINSDFVCPSCGKDGVLIDDLVQDEEMVKKIKAFEDEKLAEKKSKDAPATKSSPKPEDAKPLDSTAKASTEDITGISGTTAADGKESSSGSAKGTPQSTSVKPVSPNSTRSPKGTPVSVAGTPSKKRPAEEELPNNRIPTAPAAMRKQQQEATKPVAPPAGSLDAFISQMNALAGTNGTQPPMMSQAAPPAAANGFPMNGMNGMPGMPGMNGMGYNGMPGMGFPSGNWAHPQQHTQQHAWNGMNGMNGMHGMGAMNGMHMNGMNGGGAGRGGHVFPNQQRVAFSKQTPSEEDNAYFRQPVNPHRHQNRQRRARPSDYTEI
ncbi:DWNN-domain-containing protein [Saccharata proteae CBS 121410]|uniref:DWNN-domain-containing protein n=1 Tax=Saccharata proteae CBS 121410 TaxID=1314787 RepID=A0A9P4HMY0_9PEZI|nr:DWNN-domain-containing protein [Saccharata proteae CBS 121410]